MPSPLIIVISDAGRADFLKVFDQVKTKLQLVFIDSKAVISEKNTNLYETYGSFDQYENYLNAFDLLEKYQPQKLVFFNYESFNQVALLAAAKELGYPTYHLEHGIRINTNIIYDQPQFKNRIKSHTAVKALLYSKNRFFKSTVSKSSDNYKNLLELYYNVRVSKSPDLSYRELGTNMIIPDFFITPNSQTAKFHSNRHKISLSQDKIIFTGFPQFEKYEKLLSIECSENNNVIFIDQPLHELKLFGWTRRLKQVFLEKLVKSLNEYNIYVKPHPKNDKTFYPNGINILNDDEFYKQLIQTNIFIGFCSTLFYPICSLSHTTVLLFENHLVTPNIKLSSEFTKNKVATELSSFDDLSNSLNKLNQIKIDQKKNKSAFREYNNIFQGNAIKKLEAVLLN